MFRRLGAAALVCALAAFALPALADPIGRSSPGADFRGVEVSDLPACSAAHEGWTRYVIDGDAGDRCGTGGGATKGFCYCDSANWIPWQTAGGGSVSVGGSPVADPNLVAEDGVELEAVGSDITARLAPCVTSGHVRKWDGDSWECAADATGGTPDDGSVTLAKVASQDFGPFTCPGGAGLCTLDGNVVGPTELAHAAGPTGVDFGIFKNITGLGLVLNPNVVQTGNIADLNVTYSKLPNQAQNTILARSAAGSGSPSAHTVGNGVEFSGGGLRRAQITGGDVECAAGSATCTVTDDSHAHTGSTVSNLDTGDVTSGTFPGSRTLQTATPTRLVETDGSGNPTSSSLTPSGVAAKLDPGDAEVDAYTPATPADWPDPDPATLKAALDKAAAQLTLKADAAGLLANNQVLRADDDSALGAGQTLDLTAGTTELGTVTYTLKPYSETFGINYTNALAEDAECLSRHTTTSGLTCFAAESGRSGSIPKGQAAGTVTKLACWIDTVASIGTGDSVTFDVVEGTVAGSDPAQVSGTAITFSEGGAGNDALTGGSIKTVDLNAALASGSEAISVRFDYTDSDSGGGTITVKGGCAVFAQL